MEKPLFRKGILPRFIEKIPSDMVEFVDVTLISANLTAKASFPPAKPLTGVPQAAALSPAT